MTQSGHSNSPVQCLRRRAKSLVVRPDLEVTESSGGNARKNTNGKHLWSLVLMVMDAPTVRTGKFAMTTIWQRGFP